MTSTDESTADFTIERFDDFTVIRPQNWFGTGGHKGSVYMIRRNDDPIWSVGIDFGDSSHVPFREELYWASTRTFVIGGGNVAYFFDARSGDLQTTIAVPSLFGHFALVAIPTASGAAEEVLLVMGWTDVHAIGSQLETRWIARDIAVDGIVFVAVRDCAVILSAEMDPPGGWVDVALDVHTGAELWRER
ncbi:MAG TPA: hypothetical protein PK156_31250 [Polyangium sp.]|nr:hypothetical protein [Polyangium sp.]